MFVAGGTLFRAVRQGYIETINNTRLVGETREMAVEEAIKILDLKYSGKNHVFSAVDLSFTRDKLIKLNSPSANSQGSPYLIARINDAHNTIISKCTVKN